MASNGNGHSNGNGNRRGLATLEPPLPEPSARDLEIYEVALTAVPFHTIAQQFKMSIKEIEAALARACRPFNAANALLARSLAIERWNRLTAVYYPAALKGDIPSAVVLAKIDERRSALDGSDVPASMRRDPVMLQVEVTPQETSGEKFDRVYAQLTGKIFDGEKYVDPEPKPDDSSTPEAKPEPQDKPE